MHSYKKLFNNSIIFGFGNIGSKIVTFLLLPLYTYYLSTSEFGTVDLILTTVSLILPLASFSIYDAVLRFTMEKKIKNTTVISNTAFILFLVILINLILYSIGKSIIKNEYFEFLIIILLVQILEMVLSQYARALGYIKGYAFNGILLSFTMGILIYTFLVKLTWGIEGYFYALIISNIISILYLVFLTKVLTDINISEINVNSIIMLLKYSIPLIPNSIMWWLINASNKYFITYFVGLSSMGLFGIANRIPALITLFSQIFSQAWQLSAIEELENENPVAFYSNVFKYLSFIMSLAVFFVNLTIQPIFKVFFSSEYYEGWKIVPFLLLAATFSAYSSFIGASYIASKKTKGIFKTSILGGVVSLTLNFILIPFFGILGAGVSSLISFTVIFLIRLYDTREFLPIKIEWKRFVLIKVSLIFQIIILLSEINVIFLSFYSLINFTLILFCYKLEILSIIKLTRQLFKKLKRFSL